MFGDSEIKNFEGGPTRETVKDFTKTPNREQDAASRYLKSETVAGDYCGDVERPITVLDDCVSWCQTSKPRKLKRL